jgi:hypothetical protein
VLLALLALVVVALILALPTVLRAAATLRRRSAERRVRRAPRESLDLPDPGSERRAEQRARQLLRSCVNEEEWAMYRDLGFIRVYGAQGRPSPGLDAPAGERSYAYLIYPHKPIVAYLTASGRLLSEYCVEFPDLTMAVSRSRLPDSDDVLAKWMALTSDERRLISDANMHLPGRQVDAARVRRDVWRLAEWERRRGDRLAASE